MPTIVTGGEETSQSNNFTTEDISRDEENISETYQQSSIEDDVQQTLDDTQPPKTSTGMIATPTIVNQTVPVVVFVGPPSSGKSMILVRLAKFLRDTGYTIKTDPTFLNTSKYHQDCQEFQDKLNTNVALPGSVEFLLVNVYKSGTEIAKLLEAPGEDFYTTDPNKKYKNSEIESYLATIMTSNNPKTYVVLLDLDSDISFRSNGNHRDSYAQRFLRDFFPNINLKRDKIVLLYNKIDKTQFGNINGCTYPKKAREDAKMYYKQIFENLKGGLFNMDLFAFKTFCTGKYTKQTDDLGNTYWTYNQATDIYPRELWKEIIKKW